MSEVQSGVSASYVDNEIAALRQELRSELRDEINNLRNWMEHEIERLEKEMREVGEMIVGAINQQTVVLVSGVAASTAMIESTKQQIERDFDRTRGKIEIQTEIGIANRSGQESSRR